MLVAVQEGIVLFKIESTCDKQVCDLSDLADQVRLSEESGNVLLKLLKLMLCIQCRRWIVEVRIDPEIAGGVICRPLFANCVPVEFLPGPFSVQDVVNLVHLYLKR